MSTIPYMSLTDFCSAKGSYNPDWITADERVALLRRWCTLAKDSLYDRLLVEGFRMELWPTLYDHVYEHIDDLITDAASTFETFQVELERVVLLVARTVQIDGHKKVYATDAAKQNAWEEHITTIEGGSRCCE
jgi:hypothetical protein